MRGGKIVMNKLRMIIPAAILLVAGVAFAVGGDVGTLSAFGWRDIALICPVGSLSAMLAAKMMIPRAVVSLVLFVVATLILGRAFCGWVCPVPLVERLRGAFSSSDGKTGKRSGSGARDESESSANADVALSKADSIASVASADGTGVAGAASAADAGDADGAAAPAASPKPLTASEKRMLKSCSSCADSHGTLDSRHVVLAGGLLSAAIFGFPVVCLVCPIGLTFATIFLLIRAFGFGDPTWALVVVPVFLILEVVVFRKWCHWLCPVSALLSLVSKGNRTLRPTIDDGKCLETAQGRACGVCSRVCPEGIDVRHPESGNGINECTRCLACSQACPGQAISFPLVAKDSGAAKPPEASEQSPSPVVSEGSLR